MPEFQLFVSCALLFFFTVMAVKTWYYEFASVSRRFSTVPLFFGTVGCVGLCLFPLYDLVPYWYFPYVLDAWSLWFVLKQSFLFLKERRGRK